MLTSLLKKSLLMAIAVLLATFTASALDDYTASYDCERDNLSNTLLKDTDGDGVYDSYGVAYCGDEENPTILPLRAIGNIRTWPPSGGPTRSIALSGSGQSLSVLETYYSSTGAVIAWFEKNAGNDTVYFHSGGYDDLINFDYDESASYIQTYPNPASYILNIRYTVRTAGTIKIHLYDTQGHLQAYILDGQSGTGEYNMVFPVANITNGYYRLNYYTGGNWYSITIAINR
ncbi:MAG: T9SS type A sorting domain-containing protein [Candidatus Woesearchaeota archaeon]